MKNKEFAPMGELICLPLELVCAEEDAGTNLEV
jgi:hypothetical protein